MTRTWYLLVILLLAVEGASLGWRFLAKRVSLGGGRSPQLGFRVPVGEEGSYRRMPVEANQVSGLACDAGERYWWRGNRGESVEILTLTYLEGNARLHEDLLYHPPDLCMSLSGVPVAEVYPERVLRVEGKPPLRLRAIRLGRGEATAGYVLKGIWFPEESGWVDDFDERSHRLKRALWLHTLPPGYIAMAAIRGVESYERAEEVYREVLVRCLELQIQEPASNSRQPETKRRA